MPFLRIKFLICQMDIYLPDFVKLLQVCFEKHRVFYEGTVSFSWGLGYAATS